MVAMVVLLVLVVLATLAGQGTEAATRQPAYQLYKDMQQPVEARVQDLLARMTLAEKIGQMTQTERSIMNHTNIRDYGIGKLIDGLLIREDDFAASHVGNMERLQVVY